VQSSGFELIYADTDAVFLKKNDATRSDYEEIINDKCSVISIIEDLSIICNITEI
jgi:hypothetical protein